jgi:hypothetical protein
MECFAFETKVDHWQTLVSNLTIRYSTLRNAEIQTESLAVILND